MPQPQAGSKPAWRIWIDRLCGTCALSAAPGRERIASSPLVIGLVASLAILVGMGFWLKAIIASTIATRTFNRGLQDFDDGDYRTAIRDFDSFLEVQSRGYSGRQGQGLAGVRQRPAVRLTATGRPGRRRSRPRRRCWSRWASSRNSATCGSTWRS